MQLVTWWVRMIGDPSVWRQQRDWHTASAWTSGPHVKIQEKLVSDPHIGQNLRQEGIVCMKLDLLNLNLNSWVVITNV